MSKQEFGWYFWVGLLAACCIVVYMIPQLYKTVKTKNTESLSKYMLIISTVGSLLFVISGIGMILDSLPDDLNKGLEGGLSVVIANFVSFTITLTLFIIKMVSRTKAKKMGISEGQYAKLLLAKKKVKKVIKGK